MVHTNSHNPNRTLFCLFLKSGLSCWIGEQLLGLQHLALPVVMLAVTVVVAVVTEVISNVATITLFLPVLASMVSNIAYSGMITLHSCTHILYMHFIGYYLYLANAGCLFGDESFLPHDSSSCCSFLCLHVASSNPS